MDIYYILKKKNFNLNKVIQIAKIKLKNTNDNFDIERIFNNLDLIENLWEKDLREILPNIPNFNTVVKKLRKGLEK